MATGANDNTESCEVELNTDCNRINRARDDPHGLARSWLASLEGRGNGVRVVYHRGEYLLWEGDSYREIPAGDLRSRLTRHVQQEFERENEAALEAWAERAQKDEQAPVLRKVTTRLISDVLQALGGECLLPANIDLPTWITDAGTVDEERVACDDPRMMLAMPSGILNLALAATGNAQCCYPPTPRFFTRSAVTYDDNADAAAPRWVQFMNQIFGTDEESIRALQEWFGYLLTARTDLQKILALIGMPRSGKGTIARVLTKLLGAANVGSVRLEDLGSRFGLFPLRAKTVALIADLRLSDRADRSAVVERLLSVSGEDDQPIEQKYGTPYTARLPTRFVIISNELPRLMDASAALASRLIIIRTMAGFIGRENTNLTNLLLTELPGILNWALRGLERLNEQGALTQPRAADDDVQSMRDMSSPVGAFVRDKCRLAPDARIGIDALYGAFKRWCEAEGKKYVPTKEIFGHDLKACVGVARIRPRDSGTGRQLPHYQGITLLTGP